MYIITGSSLPAQTAFGAPHTPLSQFGQQPQQPVLQPSPFGPPQQPPSLPFPNATPFPASQPAHVGGAQPQPGFAVQPQALVSVGQPAAAAEGKLLMKTAVLLDLPCCDYLSDLCGKSIGRIWMMHPWCEAGSMQQSTGGVGSTAEEDAVWRAPTFAPGCIPDKPPPPIYCQ